jgi:hypothetical protein
MRATRIAIAVLTAGALGIAGNVCAEEGDFGKS